MHLSGTTIIYIETHEIIIIRATPPAQEGRRNPAAALPLSIREVASK